jgi:hypothetical protein
VVEFEIWEVRTTIGLNNMILVGSWKKSLVYKNRQISSKEMRDYREMCGLTKTNNMEPDPRCFGSTLSLLTHSSINNVQSLPIFLWNWQVKIKSPELLNRGTDPTWIYRSSLYALPLPFCSLLNLIRLSEKTWFNSSPCPNPSAIFLLDVFGLGL